MARISAAPGWRPLPITTLLLATCAYSCAGAASHASASRQHVLAAGHATTQTLAQPSSEAATMGSVAKTTSCAAVYPPGEHNLTIDVNGTTRRFLLKVPFHVDASDGLPALVSIHGRASNPWYFDHGVQQTDWYNEDQYDDADPDSPAHLGYKWLVALPFGTPAAGKQANPNCCGNKTMEECSHSRVSENECGWNAGYPPDADGGFEVYGDDIGFFRALAGWLRSEMCATAMFATGMSLGASMSNRIGCDLAGVYQGVAPVEGPFLWGNGFEKCEPSTPVSVLQFCGTDDGVCNEKIDLDMPIWAEANGCNSTAPTIDSYVSNTTHCRRYAGCAGEAFVEWCMIDDLPHSYVGHTKVGDYPSQPPTNVDGFVYIMDRFSSLVARAPSSVVAT